MRKITKITIVIQLMLSIDYSGVDEIMYVYVGRNYYTFHLVCRSHSHYIGIYFATPPLR